jgi:hypothetical protein
VVAVQMPASAQPNAVLALVLSGMNDVLNSQGYTQALNTFGRDHLILAVASGHLDSGPSLLGPTGFRF